MKAALAARTENRLGDVTKLGSIINYALTNTSNLTNKILDEYGSDPFEKTASTEITPPVKEPTPTFGGKEISSIYKKDDDNDSGEKAVQRAKDVNKAATEAAVKAEKEQKDAGKIESTEQKIKRGGGFNKGGLMQKKNKKKKKKK